MYPLRGQRTPPYHVRMTTQPAPAPKGYIPLGPAASAVCGIRCSAPSCPPLWRPRLLLRRRPQPPLPLPQPCRGAHPHHLLRLGPRLLLRVSKLPREPYPGRPRQTRPHAGIGVLQRLRRSGSGAPALQLLHPATAGLAMARPHSARQTHPHRRVSLIRQDRHRTRRRRPRLAWRAGSRSAGRPVPLRACRPRPSRR